MGKYSNVFLGVANNDNFRQLQHLCRKDNIILFSMLDFNLMNINDLNYLKDNIINNIIFIPNTKNIISLRNYKKVIELSQFISIILNLKQIISINMKNNAVLYCSNNNENWHKEYKGNFGYAVSANEIDYTNYYGYSAKIPNDKSKILTKEYDGIFLQNIQ